MSSVRLTIRDARAFTRQAQGDGVTDARPAPVTMAIDFEFIGRRVW